MVRALLGALAALAALVALAAAVIYAGLVDVAADSPHGALTLRLIETARERAIERNSRDVAVPPDLHAKARVRRGAGNYDAMCVNCHLKPGVRGTEIRAGLYPRPPDLTRAAPAVVAPGPAAARRFWIIKHGIKASAMPAWAKGGMADADIWDLVAFLVRLPSLGQEQYRALVEASGGHTHSGMAHPPADK